MGKTNTIERIPKIRDRDSINIIARVLTNEDRDTRVLTNEDRDSVAIAPIGDSADRKINARVRDIEDRDSIVIVTNVKSIISSHQRANVTTHDLAIVGVATIGNPTINASRRRDTNNHNKRRPTPSTPSTPSPT